MAINLVKGQKIDLTKGHKGLDYVVIGLGWDRINSGGFIKRMFSNDEDMDIDASLFALKDDKLRDSSDVVYYGNLKHKTKAIIHCGDNLVGGVGLNRGDDEQIKIKLSGIPKEYNRLVVVINIYNCAPRHQHFGMVNNAYARLFDSVTKEEICRYNLTEDYSDKTALIVGELYRYENEWKFSAIGEGTKDTSIPNIADRYK